MNTSTQFPGSAEDAEREALRYAACLPGEEILFPEGRWVQQPSLYRSALQALRSEIEIIRQEWKSDEGFSPIEHIKTRIKEPDSILDKLSRLGVKPTLDHTIERIHDLAGMRIVFAFVTDIYLLLDRIDRHPNLQILWTKDYIMNPKPNGYRSLHAELSVPVMFAGRLCHVRVEVQMRTLAMDFWASLEHILLYKYDRRVPDHLVRELSSAAGAAGELDHKMLALRSEVLSLSDEDEQTQHAARALQTPVQKAEHRQTLHKPRIVRSERERRIGIRPNSGGRRFPFIP
ncbi:GTP pyrophosphokinase [Saccharibacillus kuerlensis]|uniref:RelA/SpoT domain-containing protein n=1 Tax=Saccharibacillus kuerlensis TaxID=459527 RepID=A0ABQ2L1K2_9BACL|nr:GTP pyrophosphokinase family protein [Saccharibacillus kuerlensis]GGN99668.1 hypothetical protein GCM10010969_19960 [Saccharibacillus kuerlensis]